MLQVLRLQRRGRSARPALQGHRRHTGRPGELHPGATTWSRLLRQCSLRTAQTPGPRRQAQGAGPASLLLQLDQPPTVVAGQQSLQRLIAAATGLAAGSPPLGFGLLKHLGDRSARKDVVKLLKQQGPPVGRFHRRALRSEQVLQGLGQVRLAQQSLQGAVVALLIRPAGGTAAVQLQIELIAPHRQLRRQRRQPRQVPAQAAVGLGGGQRLLLPELQLLEHLGGGATAVITNTGQPQGLLHPRGGLPGAAVGVDRQGITIGADRRGGESQQLAAAAAAPAEQPVGKGLAAVPGELVGAEPLHPGTAGHRRQPHAEAEAVGQPAEVVVPLGKVRAAVGLAQSELLQQRGGADQHAIALHPRAIDRLKATVLHRRPQPGEQRRPVLLDPGVERRGGMGEMELRETLHQGQRRFEGAHRRLPGISHGPEPGQIEVGVAQHLHRSGRVQQHLLLEPGLERGSGSGIGRVEGPELLQQCRLRLGRQALRSQRQARRRQHTRGVRRIDGLLLHRAGDQGAVVVKG